MHTIPSLLYHSPSIRYNDTKKSFLTSHEVEERSGYTYVADELTTSIEASLLSASYRECAPFIWEASSDIFLLFKKLSISSSACTITCWIKQPAL